MADKNLYTLSTSTRTAKPRSKKLQKLGSSSVTSSSSVSADSSTSNFANFMAKFNSIFALVDSSGNEVASVDDAVAVKIKNGLSLFSDGDIVAFNNE